MCDHFRRRVTTGTTAGEDLTLMSPVFSWRGEHSVKSIPADLLKCFFSTWLQFKQQHLNERTSSKCAFTVDFVLLFLTLITDTMVRAHC